MLLTDVPHILSQVRFFKFLSGVMSLSVKVHIMLMCIKFFKFLSGSDVANLATCDTEFL